tara:strand:- start:407 stop:646 length:240 start_codon:yes stop_codon:yes gene_type:complete
MLTSFRIQHYISGHIPPVFIALASGQDDDHLQPFMAVAGDGGSRGVAKQGDVWAAAGEMANLDAFAKGLERHVLPAIGH